MRLALLATLALSGCGAPWILVNQSGPPSALAGAQQITYASDFNQSLLDGVPIGQVLAAESPNEQASIQATLQQMDQELVNAFASGVSVPVVAAAGPPQPGEVRCTAIYTQMQRGARGPVGRATDISVQLSWSVGGQITDEVIVQSRIGPSITRASVSRRMVGAGRQLGQLAARFFNSEQGR